MTPPALAPFAAAQSGEACLLIEVHPHIPPAELAIAWALWASAAAMAALTLYWLIRAVKLWHRPTRNWLDGYEAGKAARLKSELIAANESGVVPFPGNPAA